MFCVVVAMHDLVLGIVVFSDLFEQEIARLKYVFSNIVIIQRNGSLMVIMT